MTVCPQYECVSQTKQKRMLETKFLKKEKNNNKVILIKNN
jgi:hypothetical protein